MKKLSAFATRRAGATLGAIVLASVSMAVAGPSGVAFAASKASKAPAPRPAAQLPAASGQISYISGDTVEVRSQESGQTSVKITPKTAISATVAVSLKAVVKGSCVTATGTKAKNGALDAATVTLVAATAGKCQVGGGFGSRASRGGGSFRPPAGASRTAPRHFTVPANEASAFGKVTSVSGPTLSVVGTMFSFSGAARSSSGSRKGSTSKSVPKVKKVTVEVSSKTKYLKTGPGSAKSLKVGECATAFGPANSIGTVTATRLSVGPPTSGSCGFSGFGAGGFRGGGFGGGGFGGAVASAKL